MAGRIPDSFIDDVLGRTDIVELINQRVPLKRAGANYQARCPFHNEKSPSFTVSPSKQFYHCFGCGAHGSAIGFLMQYDRLEFIEAVTELAKRAGLQLPDEARDRRPEPDQDLFGVLEAAARCYRHALKHDSGGPQAIAYLKDRGLTGDIAARFGIGYAPDAWDTLIQQLNKPPALLEKAGLTIKKAEHRYYDRFRHRIMFPIRDRRGRVIGFGGRVLDNSTPKYLNSPETPLFHKGRELYGLHEALEANNKLDRVVVVEGYMDVVALAQFGVTNAVATLGTATTRDHIERLLRHTSEIVFCFDGDNAGRKAAWRALESALPLAHQAQQIRFLFLPETEDPDSLVRKEGATAFAHRVQNAQPLSGFLLSQLKQQVDLHSVDGRARLIELSKPLIASMPDSALRTLLIEEISEQARLQSHKVNQILKPTLMGTTPRHAAPTLHTSQKTIAHGPIRHAIDILLQNSALAAQCGDPTRFAELPHPDIPLLIDLVHFLQDHPDAHLARLLEHWHDSEYHQALIALATREQLIPPEALPDNLVGALQKLEHERAEQRYNELEQRQLEQGRLAPHELEEWRQLLYTLKTSQPKPS
jgi:DNA primase